MYKKSCRPADYYMDPRIHGYYYVYCMSPPGPPTLGHFGASLQMYINRGEPFFVVEFLISKGIFHSSRKILTSVYHLSLIGA